MARILYATAVATLFSIAYAGGAEDTWYEHDYEYNFLETIIVMIFVAMALVFETTWHHLVKRSENAYRYGELRKLVEGTDDIQCECPAYVKNLQLPPSLVNRDGTLRHIRLTRELVSRAGGEFMTLGFLAFSIFTFNQAGGFYWLAKTIPSSDPKTGWRYPKTATQWLHTAEEVHMELFVGMVIYFLLMSRAATGTVRWLTEWEEWKLRRQTLGRHMRVETIDLGLADHILWRRFFLLRMTRLAVRYPKAVESLIDEMGLDPDMPDFPSTLLANLEKAFGFSTYLAVNIEHGVRDSIHVNRVTWVLSLVGLAVLALLHRFFQVTFVAILPAIVFCAVVCLGTMRVVIRRTLYRIKTGVRAMQENVVDWPIPTQQQQMPMRRPMDIMMMRMLQIILFLMGNTFSRTVTVANWKASPVNTAIFTTLFSVIFIAVAIDLPFSVPLFLAMTSMPPHVNPAKYKVFCAVQMQAMSQQRAKALADLEVRLAALLDEAQAQGLREDELRIRLSLRRVVSPGSSTANPSMPGAGDSDGEATRSRRQSRRIDLAALANFDNLEMAGSGCGTPAPASRPWSRCQSPIDVDHMEVAGSRPSSRCSSRGRSPVDLEAIAHLAHFDFPAPRPGSRRTSKRGGQIDFEARPNLDNLEIAASVSGDLPRSRRPSCRAAIVRLEARAKVDNSAIGGAGPGLSPPRPRRPSFGEVAIDPEAVQGTCDGPDPCTKQWLCTKV